MTKLQPRTVWLLLQAFEQHPDLLAAFEGLLIDAFYNNDRSAANMRELHR